MLNCTGRGVVRANEGAWVPLLTVQVRKELTHDSNRMNWSHSVVADMLRETLDVPFMIARKLKLKRSSRDHNRTVH